MSTALKSPTLLLAGLLLSLAVFLVSILGAELYPTKSELLLLLAASATFICWWLCYQLRAAPVAKRLSKLAKGSLLLVLCLVTAHFLLNVINIYQYEPLPGWFYTLKLFRLITLSGLFWTQLILLLLGMTLSLSARKQHLCYSLPVLVVLALLLIPVYVQLQKALAFSYSQVIQMSLNVRVPFSDRFTYKQGGTTYYGWIWPYSLFLIKHTPSDAVLVIPPQNNIWKMEGNNDYFRWFMYPRKLVSLQDGQIPEQATHLLIALGECNISECGWPKITIPKERIAKIILIDRETQEEVTITDMPYRLDTDKFKWGIIELQK